MMWRPTQSGPMTHFVPRVTAEEKIVLMWEHWNQSDSPKSASPTLYPHPGRSKLPSSPDISKLHKCWIWATNCAEKAGREGRLSSFTPFLRKSPTLKHAAETWSKQITIIEGSQRARSASPQFQHVPSQQRKPPIQNEMLFTSASLWLLSDVTVTISSSHSLSCLHTTHTQMSQ